MIYLTLHFFKVSNWKCLYYAICKKNKTKMSTLRYLLQKLKIRQVIQKKGITIVGLLIMMLLSKSLGFQKIKLLYHSSLYPPTTYHVRIFLVRVIFSYAGFHNFHKKLL